MSYIYWVDALETKESRNRLTPLKRTGTLVRICGSCCGWKQFLLVCYLALIGSETVTLKIAVVFRWQERRGMVTTGWWSAELVRSVEALLLLVQYTVFEEKGVVFFTPIFKKWLRRVSNLLQCAGRGITFFNCSRWEKTKKVMSCGINRFSWNLGAKTEDSRRMLRLGTNMQGKLDWVDEARKMVPSEPLWNYSSTGDPVGKKMGFNE